MANLLDAPKTMLWTSGIHLISPVSFERQFWISVCLCFEKRSCGGLTKPTVLIMSPAYFLNMMNLREGQTHRYSSSFGVGFGHYFWFSFLILLEVPWLVHVFNLAENCHAKTDGKHSSYKMWNLVFCFVLSGELARQRKEPAALPIPGMCFEMSKAYKIQMRTTMSEIVGGVLAGTLGGRGLRLGLHPCFSSIPTMQKPVCGFFSFWMDEQWEKKHLYFRKQPPKLESKPLVVFLSFNHGNFSSQ